MVTETVVQPVQERQGPRSQVSIVASLRVAVYGRLDYVERLVADSGLRSRRAGGHEISRLTAAWPNLPAAHEPNGHGRCPQCSGCRRHPCSVSTTAHQHLVAADGPPQPGPVCVRRPPDGQTARCWGLLDQGTRRGPNAAHPAVA